MDDHSEKMKPPRVRLLRYLPLLIILGLAVHLLVPQITLLEHSWSVVRKLAWWAVGLAFIAQALSYMGNGYLLHSILKSNREELPSWRGAMISMASQSIGMVAGGWIGGAAATYTWVHRASRDNNTAVLAGTLPALVNNAVLAAVAMIGTLYLLLVHDLKKAQLIEFSIILVVLTLLSAGVLVGLRYPAGTIRLLTWYGQGWAKIRRRAFQADEIVAGVDQYLNAWRSLGGGRWLQPLLGGIANIGFDILTLFFLFVAAGHSVSPGILLAGYGLPLILGKMAFLFPGGVGVIEGSMVALYTSLQVPNEISVVVILGYRLISFWIPAICGFLAAAYLSRSSAHEKDGENTLNGKKAEDPL